jgi:hypothetical protein
LLADGMVIVPGDPVAATGAIVSLLNDPARLARMGAAGRERMGSAGGAAAIAHAIVKLAGEPA